MKCPDCMTSMPGSQIRMVWGECRSNYVAMRLKCQTCDGQNEIHTEVLTARKYYGPHATGHVLLVNGHVHLHGSLEELKKSPYFPKDAWNPRYVAYAKAHGCTPEKMLQKDKECYPGGCMCGFILWINAKWREWETLTGNIPPHATRDQDEFDAWLNERGES